MRSPRPLLAWLAVLFVAVPASSRAADPFSLKDGDRVVFYGDSITDQRLYTTYVETFVVTRFPQWNVTFVHSGWSGDRVTGGGGGSIDERLRRDVFAHGPTVVTVMLGMNDASYRPFEPGIFDAYARGYGHLVDSVKRQLPGARMTLIVPSPFDDVTREPKFEGGYNAVLVRYGEFVKTLAKDKGVDVADLNTPVVQALRKAHATDPQGAEKINPDRIHPAPAGQLLMAAALLKAWRAPALVSGVMIQAGDNLKSETAHATISRLDQTDKGLSWTQRDERLPFPIDFDDSTTALAVKSSDLVEELDRQPLKIDGLKEGDYLLKIDGREIGTFRAGELADGINLATRSTPMVDQARAVHKLTLKHNDVHYERWRNLQLRYRDERFYSLDRALSDLDAFEADLVKEQRSAAQPKPRNFVLERKD